MKEKIKNWHNIVFILTVLFIVLAVLLLILDFSGKINLPSMVNTILLSIIAFGVIVPFWEWLSK